jgi:hypothetical protein
MIAEDTEAGQSKLSLLVGKPSWEHLLRGPMKDSWEDTACRDNDGSWVPLREVQDSRRGLAVADRTSKRRWGE